MKKVSLEMQNCKQANHILRSGSRWEIEFYATMGDEAVADTIELCSDIARVSGMELECA